MHHLTTGPSRRRLLAASAGPALAGIGLLATAGPAQAADPAAGPSAGPSTGLERQLRGLERQHAARLGVLAHDTADGRTVRYRAGERFPICSVHKVLTVSAVLRDLDRHGDYLQKRVHYTEADVERAVYAPITGTPENLAHGMTVAELCAAALDYSDNCADNLLLARIGGPHAVTRFARSIGDRVTRLDRWEPQLNYDGPGRVEDTTTPAAIGGDVARLVLGRELPGPKRSLLTNWMLHNTTSAHQFHAGVPSDSTIADKTGSGGWGSGNDVGILWPPHRRPIVLAVMTTKFQQDAASDPELIARTTALVTAALSG